MGKIYFNKKIGEFWESNIWQRKPPEGFEYTGYTKDYRRKPRGYIRERFFCPTCREYHFYINLYGCFPLYAVKLIELTEKYGCEEARKIVRVASRLGGRERHYNIVEALRNKGLLDKWMQRLMSIDPKLGRRAAMKLLNGEDEVSVEAWIIAETLRK